MPDQLYIYEMWKSRLIFLSNFLWCIFTLLIKLCNCCSLWLRSSYKKVLPQNYGFRIIRQSLNHNLVITDLTLPRCLLQITKLFHSLVIAAVRKLIVFGWMSWHLTTISLQCKNYSLVVVQSDYVMSVYLWLCCCSLCLHKNLLLTEWCKRNLIKISML
jgi:hypothetical protein